MFAYIHYTDNSGKRYVSHPKHLVKVLEFTHENSAHKRAKVKSEQFGEFYVSRANLKYPIILHSDANFQIRNGVFVFWLELRADFFKHPDNAFVDDETPYVITQIKANGNNFASLEQLAEYTQIGYLNLLDEVKTKLFEYCDELPF